MYLNLIAKPDKECEFNPDMLVKCRQDSNDICHAGFSMNEKVSDGIYGEHTQQASLYNNEVRQYLLSQAFRYEEKRTKYGVKVLHQFHSGCEYTFLWLMEADSAQSIEDLMARLQEDLTH